MNVSQKHNEVGEKEFVENLIPQIIGQGGSFMFWRLPESDEKNLIVCNSGGVMQDEITLEDSKTGFAFAPFQPDQKKFFFVADLIFRFKGEELTDGPDLTATRYAVPSEEQTKSDSHEFKPSILRPKNPNQLLSLKKSWKVECDKFRTVFLKKLFPQNLKMFAYRKALIYSKHSIGYAKNIQRDLFLWFHPLKQEPGWVPLPNC